MKNEMKKNSYSTAWSQLQKKIKEVRKTLTTKSFLGQTVFVHHYDGSYFIFRDAFVHDMSVFQPNEDGENNVYEWHVVFSRYLEPQAFHTVDLYQCVMYGEEEEKTWEKEEAYRPRIIHQPAKDYLKKNNKVLTCKDFNYATVIVDVKWYATMSLSYAKVEVVDDTIYIFTEHQGYYAFKKKEIRSLAKIKKQR